MRQPGRGGQHPAGAGATAPHALGEPVPRGRGTGAGEPADPAAGHHPQHPDPIRRPAPARGRGPRDAAPAAAAGAGRANRVARRPGIGPGRSADRGPARAGHDDPARVSRHRADVPAGRPHRGDAAGADRGRPRPAQHPPRRRGRAAVRPAGGLLGAPPAHPAAPARRPAGVGRSLLQPVADPVRARRGAGHRAAVHPPGRRPGADLRRVARVLPRAARPGGRRSRSARRGARSAWPPRPSSR